MKKIIAFAFTALLLSGILCSCNMADPVSLVGTTWKTSENIDYSFIEFSTNTCTITTRTTTSTSLVIESIDYDYTYNVPNVYMTALNEGKSDLRGVVEGDMLTLTNVSTGREIAVFLRYE
jgi:hypothetical protein